MYEIVTYLEMTEPNQLAASAPVPGLSLERLTGGSPLIPDLQARIGVPHGWESAHRSAEEWAAWLAEHPDRIFWLICLDGDPAGMVTYDLHPGGEVEIETFGLLPEFVGKGLGGYALTLAIRQAWQVADSVNRVWLHTSSLDHRNALPNYRRRGFRPFKVEEGERAHSALPRRHAGRAADERVSSGTVSTAAGKRTDELRAAVIAATVDVLVERGYESLSVEEVARRAGVSEGAVGDRWADADALIDELLDELGQHELVLLNTGSLETDLRALSAGIAALYTAPHRREVIGELVHAAGRNPRAAETLRRFWAKRLVDAAAPVRRAIADGELPASTDPLEVIRALGAPFYYRMFITLEPLDDELPERAAAAAIAAARAGVFTASGS